MTQNPREVATKFGKQIDTFFAKDFKDAQFALIDWISHLDETALFGPDDPFFPATSLKPQSNRGLTENGVLRAHWKTTEAVRKIVNGAFDDVGLPAYGPMLSAICRPATQPKHANPSPSWSQPLKTLATLTPSQHLVVTGK